MDYDTFCSGLKVLDIRHPHSLVPFVPLPAQQWRRENRTLRDVVLKARQGGVTTEEMARSAWTFATVPESTTVMVVPQGVDGAGPAHVASLIFERFFPYIDRNRWGESRFSWVHHNGSRFFVLSEADASEGRIPKGLKGWSLDRLHCTEVAFWDETEGHVDALSVFLPCVKPLGEVVVESTGNRRDCRFRRMWRDAVAGTNGHKAHFASWYRCHGLAVTPQNDKERSLLARGVSESQLLWYREKVAKLGQAAVDQEYPSDPEDCFR